MTPTKHTPGPWQVGGSLISGPSGEHTCEAVALVLRRPAVYGGKRYDTRDTDHAAPELGKTADANARLIAAAPDLLKALQDIIKARDFADSQSDADEYADAEDALWASIEDAEDILLKASKS